MWCGVVCRPPVRRPPRPDAGDQHMDQDTRPAGGSTSSTRLGKCWISKLWFDFVPTLHPGGGPGLGQQPDSPRRPRQQGGDPRQALRRVRQVTTPDPRPLAPWSPDTRPFVTLTPCHPDSTPPCLHATLPPAPVQVLPPGDVGPAAGGDLLQGGRGPRLAARLPPGQLRKNIVGKRC